MSIIDLMLWSERQELRRKQEELHKEHDAAFESYKSELYEKIAKEHLQANGQPADEELIEKMASELSEAIEKKSFEWKHPFPDGINLGDEEQMNELWESYNLYMHYILEQLGYGPNASEQSARY